MKILIAGATGLIGKKLTIELLKQGHEISVLTRSDKDFHLRFPLPVSAFVWSAPNSAPPANAFDDIDAVINLAGETVASRWTEEKKRKIYDSRVLYTRKLVESVNDLEKKPTVFISTSAIGFYGENERELNEDSKCGKDSDFLVKVCRDWEAELQNLDESIRQCIIRVGLVLSREGGVLQKLESLFRSGTAGPLGSGKQYMSWIHIDDQASQYIHCLNNQNCSGVFNGTSPNPITNLTFTKQFAEAVHRPAILPAPKFALNILFGEFANSIFANQKVTSNRWSDVGFKYKYENIEECLKNLFGDGHSRLFKSFQWVPLSLEEVFPFFSDEKNLEKITPASLNFKVLKKSTEEIESGTLIDYQLKIHGIPAKWRTEILDWQPPNKFVDTQLTGPYKLWHHTHTFTEVAGGTLMQDTVLYRLPLRWLGDSFGSFFVKNEVEGIFRHRTEKIWELFGG